MGRRVNLIMKRDLHFNFESKDPRNRAPTRTGHGGVDNNEKTLLKYCI